MRSALYGVVGVGAGVAMVAACGVTAVPPGDEIGTSTHAVIGNSFPDNMFPTVCVIRVVRPPDEQMMSQTPINCTCTVVGQSFVLTAARCVDDNVRLNKLDDIHVKFGTDITTGVEVGVASVELHRYFDSDNIGDADLALITLDDPHGAPIAAVRSQALTAGNVGADVTLVGFGTAENMVEGERHAVGAKVIALDSGFLRAGTATATTCEGDSGAPVFADLGAGVELIAVTLMHEPGTGCSSTVQRARIARHADRYVHAYVDRFEGACIAGDSTCTTVGCRSPDPDCDPCLWGNSCKEDCPTRDWDCPLGSFVGESCGKDGDCEEDGRCLPAVDDPALKFCSRPCTPGVASECPRGMGCAENSSGGGQCVYLTPSPGSQGFTCTLSEDCRSGICEDAICVNECDPAQGGSACPSGFQCGPSRASPGKSVCLGPGAGGGGFCTTAGTTTPSGIALAMLLALLAFACAPLRRRR